MSKEFKIKLWSITGRLTLEMKILYIKLRNNEKAEKVIQAALLEENGISNVVFLVFIDWLFMGKFWGNLVYMTIKNSPFLLSKICSLI